MNARKVKYAVSIILLYVALFLLITFLYVIGPMGIIIAMVYILSIAILSILFAMTIGFLLK